MLRSTTPLRLLALSAIALVITACSPTSPQGSTTTTEPRRATPAATPSPASSSGPTATTSGRDPSPDLSAVRVAVEPVVELEAPTALAVRTGDAALYVAERAGRVIRVADGVPDADPVLDISPQTTTDSERGLLGLTFSADGSDLYVSFTNTAGDSQLDGYRMRGATADRSTRRNLLLVTQPFSNHNGGNVVTGPDGLLYFGLGDGGAGGDPLGSGQDRSTLLGALLRVDPTPSADAPYTIPPDNPFVGDDTGRDELWVYGLRNPWRFSFDRQTDDLWIADVGQVAVEEINRLPFEAAAGANLGWNVFEGTRRFASGRVPDAVAPIFEYPHDGRCSVTGGYVYRGQRIPALRGAYVFGDFCDGVVRALVQRGGSVVDERALDVQVPALVSFGEDHDGELYVLSLEGTLYRLTAR